MIQPTTWRVFAVYDENGMRAPKLLSADATMRDGRFVVAHGALGSARSHFLTNDVSLSAESAVAAYVKVREGEAASLRERATALDAMAEAARKLVSP